MGKKKGASQKLRVMSPEFAAQSRALGQDLGSPKYRQRVVKSKKNKQPRHKGKDLDLSE